jgi:excisionase family DNA binding protein
MCYDAVGRKAHMPKEQEPKMLTVTAAARELGISPNTLRKWTDEGRVRAGRLPGRGDRRYTREELARVRREVLGLGE